MVKFKVGDLVVRKLDGRASKHWHNDNGPFRVVWARAFSNSIELHRVPKGIKDNYFSENSFEPYKAPAKKAVAPVAPKVNRKVPGHTDYYIIVLKKGDGTLAPADTPAVYTSEAQAKSVAAIMAERHPGEEFIIFEAMGTAKAYKASVEMFY